MKTGLITEKSNTPGMGGLYIVYDGAANIETSGYRGLSHLWEHLKCHSYDDIREKLMAYGIVANAYTSDRNVVYFWTGLDEKIEEVQEELLKLVSYVPTREQFELERKIVMQEYRDYTSSQNFLFGNIMRAYYNYFGPIGYRDDIENVTYEDFMDFSTRSFPNPMQIIRIGSSETINEICQSQQYFKYDIIKSLEKSDEPDLTYIEHPSTFGSTMYSQWFDVKQNSINLKDMTIINSLFCRGLSSPFYEEIREKRGLVYYCGAATEEADNDSFLWIFYAGCKNDVKEEIKNIVSEIVDNWPKYITEDRFSNVVESMLNKEKMSDISNYNSVKKHFTRDEEEVTVEYLKSISFEEFSTKLNLFRSLYNEGVKEAYSEKDITI